MVDVDVTVDHETLRRMWQGYQCFRCYQIHKESWPEVCPFPGCGYEMRKEQRADLERNYEGEDTELWKDDYEPTEERAKRSGIWVPKGITG
jgi:hypothetical protein